ncbi:hypothetical protein BC831DRAFT_12991 [Entophlyctis helioformis]|nr:hypothetical protein BC831DRAFT_12991 [Entophlyctis helioformis]
MGDVSMRADGSTDGFASADAAAPAAPTAASISWSQLIRSRKSNAPVPGRAGSCFHAAVSKTASCSCDCDCDCTASDNDGVTAECCGDALGDIQSAKRGTNPGVFADAGVGVGAPVVVGVGADTASLALDALVASFRVQSGVDKEAADSATSNGMGMPAVDVDEVAGVAGCANEASSARKSGVNVDASKSASNVETSAAGTCGSFAVAVTDDDAALSADACATAVGVLLAARGGMAAGTLKAAAESETSAACGNANGLTEDDGMSVRVEEDETRSGKAVCG